MLSCGFCQIPARKVWASWKPSRRFIIPLKICNLHAESKTVMNTSQLLPIIIVWRLVNLNNYFFLSPLRQSLCTQNGKRGPVKCSETGNICWRVTVCGFAVEGPQKGPTSWYPNCRAGHHGNILHTTSSRDKSLASKLANPYWTKRRLNVMRCMKRLPPGCCWGGRLSSFFIFGSSGQSFFFLTL